MRRPRGTEAPAAVSGMGKKRTGPKCWKSAVGFPDGELRPPLGPGTHCSGQSRSVAVPVPWARALWVTREPKEFLSGLKDTGPTPPKERVPGRTVPCAEAPPSWVRRPYLDISCYF